MPIYGLPPFSTVGVTVPTARDIAKKPKPPQAGKKDKPKDKPNGRP